MILLCKHSKELVKNAVKSGISCIVASATSIRAGRLHQRKQFIDRRLRDLANAIGVVHACYVDALHDRFDLVAKVAEEAQRIGRLVRDPRNQSRDQNLARHYASVQFVHPAPRLLAA